VNARRVLFWYTCVLQVSEALLLASKSVAVAVAGNILVEEPTGAEEPLQELDQVLFVMVAHQFAAVER
jgi:hypothetical protein